MSRQYTQRDETNLSGDVTNFQTGGQGGLPQLGGGQEGIERIPGGLTTTADRPNLGGSSLGPSWPSSYVGSVQGEELSGLGARGSDADAGKASLRTIGGLKLQHEGLKSGVATTGWSGGADTTTYSDQTRMGGSTYAGQSGVSTEGVSEGATYMGKTGTGEKLFDTSFPAQERQLDTDEGKASLRTLGGLKTQHESLKSGVATTGWSGGADTSAFSEQSRIGSSSIGGISDTGGYSHTHTGAVKFNPDERVPHWHGLEKQGPVDVPTGRTYETGYPLGTVPGPAVSGRDNSTGINQNLTGGSGFDAGYTQPNVNAPAFESGAGNTGTMPGVWTKTAAGTDFGAAKTESPSHLA
jgi:hypothetical protein